MSKILDINLEDELKQSWLLYSMSVLRGRAFPDIRDGLKPVQRRILMAMHDLNLGPTAQHRKSAKVAGDTSGNYHPHGESVIYPTIVRMAQDFNARYPLVEGQGNMGSIDGDPPAAMRYTECRMSAYAMEMLEDIDRETVDWVPNYDQTRQEPLVLPGRFPNLLANGTSGIGVVFATNIPPHNLTELCDTIMRLVDEPDLSVEQIMETLPGPDFPTAALILGKKGIEQAYTTGRGSIVLQGKATIDTNESGRNIIVINELPFQVNKARLIEQIADLVRSGKVNGISNIFDFTDRNGIRVEIELKRDAQPRKVLNYLYKHTPLRTTFAVNMLTLVSGQPRVLPIREVLQHYIDHRREIITRRTRFELSRAQARAHILEGLRIALDFIDEVIAIIRASANTEAARMRLMERFDLTQIQATAILEMQLRQLVNLERQKIDDEYRELLKRIAYLEDILTNPKKLLAIIKAETKAMRDKLGDARRTRIVPMEAEQIGDEDIIPEEEMIISLTRDGYIKRVPINTYRTQGRGGRGVKGTAHRAEDEVAQLFVATTHHYVLFFTDQGRVYRLKAYEVPQRDRTARGDHINNLIGLQPDETITTTIPIKEVDGDGYLVMVTERGEVKRIAVSEFRHLRNMGIKAFDLEEGDVLRWVKHTDGKQQVLLVTAEGQSIRFAETDLRASGRTAGGVRGIRLKEGDRVVGVALPSAATELLVAAENGIGKRTLLSQYPVQGRGGQGVKTMDVTAKTGRVIGCEVVDPDDTLLLTSRNGITVRVPVSSIRRTGRISQGVILQRTPADDPLVSLERIRERDEASAALEEAKADGARR